LLPTGFFYNRADPADRPRELSTPEVSAVTVTLCGDGSINVSFSGMRPTEAIGALYIGIEIVKKEITS
jgi:hypothetical protein